MIEAAKKIIYIDYVDGGEERCLKSSISVLIMSFIDILGELRKLCAYLVDDKTNPKSIYV